MIIQMKLELLNFRIKVDGDGDVVDVTQIESTVSPAVAQQYKRAVQRTKFKPTSDGDKPDISTGTVTFRLNPRWKIIQVQIKKVCTFFGLEQIKMLSLQPQKPYK
ncbi:MAG: hypothetical protein U5N85_12615 [Arcicella sp.]|nr:hypothetical protein [Arcicella sp.]